MQSRVIQCMHKITGRHGSECFSSEKPAAYRPCHLQPCNEKINVNTITSPRLGKWLQRSYEDAYSGLVLPFSSYVYLAPKIKILASFYLNCERNIKSMFQITHIVCLRHRDYIVDQYSLCAISILYVNYLRIINVPYTESSL